MAYHPVFSALVVVLAVNSAFAGPASGEEDSTRIPGFDYRLTSLQSEGQVKELYSHLRSDLGYDPWDRCSDRAHVWSYQLWKTRGIRSGKVFLFYTGSYVESTVTPGKMLYKSNSTNPPKRPWIWHVAPYVEAEGKLWVMEKFAYINTPLQLDDWLKTQADGAQCVELKGTEEEKVYSSYTCGAVTRDGKCSGAKRIIVPAGGAPCFYRRVPMYYYYPNSVGSHDFLGAPEQTDWTPSAPYSACMYSMSAWNKGQRRNRCSTFVNDPMASFSSEWAPPATPLNDGAVTSAN